MLNGPTSLPPGPSISTLQNAKINAAVQQGKIAVLQDTTVAKHGATITAAMANVFNLLGMEPMLIGLTLTAVQENGMIYEQSVLDIDTDAYVAKVTEAAYHAINLALHIGYITKDTAQLAIQKAFLDARTLSIECGLIDKQFIGDILARATAQADALERMMNKEVNA